MTSNEFYQVRINTVNNFITKFEKEYDDRFSAAICGSLVLGYPHKNSDVDLFLVIPSYNLRKVTSTDIFQNIFKSNAIEEVCKSFKNSIIHSYRPCEGSFEGITLSINVFSEFLFPRLANLEEFYIYKYRFASRNQNLMFRGFSNSYGQDQLPFNLEIITEEDGVLTKCKSLIWHDGEPYFHINVDKFFTAEFIRDNLGLKKCQSILRTRIIEEFLRTTHRDPFGFLAKRKMANPNQISNLCKNIPSELVNRAIPVNLGLREKTKEIRTFIRKQAHKIIIISGPTGVGKDSIVDRIINSHKRFNYYIPITTRNARRNEAGIKYFFVSEKKFIKQIKNGEFLFWQFEGYDSKGKPEYYAISIHGLKKVLEVSDKVFITVGGIPGSAAMKRLFPQCTTIFIRPTSETQLRNQLTLRKSESVKEIERHLCRLNEITPPDQVYDYTVTNYQSKLNQTVSEIAKIVMNRY